MIGHHKKRERKKKVSQVATLWIEGENPTEGYNRHIQVYTKEGWHPGIQRSGNVNPKKRKRAMSRRTSTVTLNSFRSAEELLNSEQQDFRSERNTLQAF